MDIIQLLEVLKPSKEMITVQVLSQKDQLISWIDLLKSVLPAVATAGVAWLAMNKSHRQFEKNSKRQSDEFKVGIEQQIRTLRIHTQLATEIDLKKDICKNVRNSCSEYLTNVLEFDRQNNNYNIADEYVAKGAAGFVERRSTAHELRMKASADMISSRMMLLSYLDPTEDAELMESIAEVSDHTHSDSDKVAIASGRCLALCRAYIAKKHREIVELTNSIA